MRLFTHPRTCKRGSPPRTCKRGSPLVSAITQLNLDSTTRTSLPIITSTEKTNGENFFPCSWQCLTCLSFLIFFHLAKSVVIGLFFYVSPSASPSLTSMMASTWRSHKHRIITSPRVPLSLSLPWRIYCSDLVRSWCIRGLARIDAEVNASRDNGLPF